jgi:DNA-binding response OmpR family regulator
VVPSVLAHSPEMERPNRHDAEERPVQPKLLIVEDDRSLLEVWKTIFSTRGWVVSTATTLAEGLAQLQPTPDYLILDLELPDGRGEAILRQIRELGLKTRVAVTTGSDDLARLIDLHPEALFQKPVDVAAIWQQGGFAEVN